jgi:DNA replication protein DnaC
MSQPKRKDDDSPDDAPVEPTDFTKVADDLMRKHLARMDQVAESVDRSRDPGEVEKSARARRIAALTEGRFPPRLIEAIARDRRKTPALEHADAFLRSDKTVLVLVGGTGAGKTFAGLFVAHEAGGPRPGFVRSPTLERIGRYNHEHQAWLESRTSLVLDDLGAEYMDGKGAYLSLLDELVDKAWGDKSKLVITSNMEGLALRQRLGDRVWSRICDVGAVGACGAEDLRRLR